MKIVALSSGGIDSTLMMFMLKKRGYEVIPLFIDYGQLSADLEWTACQQICEFIGLNPQRINVSGFGKVIESGITNDKLDVKEFAFLPNRNLLFLTIAASYAYNKSAYVVSIGLISNPIFPDQTKKFLKKAEECIKEALDIDMKIFSPLLDLEKIDVYNLAIKYGLFLEKTYYCHSGKEKPCGKCIACQEHIAALKQLQKDK